MRKGQNRYGNIPLYKMPTNLIYNDEIFLPITEKIVPDVLPYYLISNYGRLWHKYTCVFKVLIGISTESK